MVWKGEREKELALSPPQGFQAARPWSRGGLDATP